VEGKRTFSLETSQGGPRWLAAVGRKLEEDGLQSQKRQRAGEPWGRGGCYLEEPEHARPLAKKQWCTRERFNGSLPCSNWNLERGAGVDEGNHEKPTQ
jgi:hypothetical protein